MVDVFISDGVLHLVLEFCPYDMERVIRDKTILLQNHHVKSYMQMLLRGIECCHKHFVLHRGIPAQCDQSEVPSTRTELLYCSPFCRS
jgi:cyclin-dependent kinase 7